MQSILFNNIYELYEHKKLEESLNQKIYSRESNVYIYNGLIYKVFKDFDFETISHKEKKIELLNKTSSIKELVLPEKKILVNNKFIGYSMQYIANTKTLYDSKNIIGTYSKFVETFKKISEVLKKCHSNNIILSDLSFNNIIIDNNLNIRFVDLDSAKINDLHSDKVSGLINRFYKSHGGSIWDSQVSPEIDKLSLILLFIYMIFDTEIQYVSDLEYNDTINKLCLSSQMLDIIELIKKFEHSKIDLPYIGDCFIKENGHQFILNK